MRKRIKQRFQANAQCINQTLYHVTDLKSASSILRTGTILASDATKMRYGSDELQVGCDLFKFVIRKLCLRKGLIRVGEIFCELIDTVIQLKPPVHVVSFTKAANSLHHWRRYGDDCSVKIAIGFDADLLRNGLQGSYHSASQATTPGSSQLQFHNINYIGKFNATRFFESRFFASGGYVETLSTALANNDQVLIRYIEPLLLHSVLQAVVSIKEAKHANDQESRLVYVDWNSRYDKVVRCNGSQSIKIHFDPWHAVKEVWEYRGGRTTANHSCEKLVTNQILAPNCRFFQV